VQATNESKKIVNIVQDYCNLNQQNLPNTYLWR